MHRPNKSLTHGLAFFLFTALLAAAAEAGQDRWTPFGRGGGDVRSLAVDPTVPGILYVAAGYGGIYRSSDEAQTWRWIGVRNEHHEWTSVVVDPDDPSRLYATARHEAGDGGLFTSGDGGLHWQALIRNLGGFRSVAVSPDGTLVASTPASEVYRGVDGGRTWIRVIEEGLFSTTPALQITADPLAPGTFYAWGDRLSRSTDGGATWTVIGTLPDGQPVDFVPAFAVSGSRAGFLYAVVHGGLYRSDDGGLTWAGGALLPDSAVSLAVDPADSRTVYASGYRLHVSHDGGATVTELPQPGRDGFGSFFPLIATSPAAPGTLYVSLSEQGVAASRDAGAHWTLTEQQGLTAGLMYGFFLDFHAAPSGRLYQSLGFGTGGVSLRSLDRGRTWSRLASPGGNVYDLTEEAGDPDSLWAGTADHLYHSTDGGASWTSAGYGYYVASPSPGVVLAGGCGAARTTDDGRTWTQVVPCSLGRGYDQIFYWLNRLNTAPGWPGAVLAEFRTDSFGLGEEFLVLFSQNSGLTWRILARRIESPRGAHAVAASQGVIYLNRGTALQRSDNAGASWESRPAGFRIQSIAVDAVDPDVVYAATENSGVLRSTDGGRTWNPTAGLATQGRLEVYDVVADPKFPSTAYAIPEKGGLFQAHFEE